MCLGVPALVLSIEGAEAEVMLGEVKYRANLGLLEGVVPGDYIILHAGFAIARLDPGEAQETIRLIRDIAETEEQ